MIWLAIAAQLSSSLPQRPLFTPYDVPVELLKRNVVQTVGIALTVDPHGRVQSCAVEESTGNAKLDSYTCRLAVRRAKFRPFRNAEGLPVYGVYRTHVRWWTGDRRPRRGMHSGNVYLTVTKLPPNERSPVLVRLAMAVDATGKASDCVAEDAKSNPVLVRLGCERSLKDFKPQPAKNVEGVPVPSVQTVAVVFEAK